MSGIEKRRSFLFSFGGPGRQPGTAAGGTLGAETAAQHGYALGADEEEHLVHFRDQGEILIKAGAAVPGFRSTDILRWTNPFTSWKAVEP